MDNKKLDITQSSDFYSLLELMLPLYNVEEYECLPELFSIIGYQKLLLLSRYAGGVTIKIPTLEELSKAIEALDWYYKVHVTKQKHRQSIPEDYQELVERIRGQLNA